jgi:hypothetical protein
MNTRESPKSKNKAAPGPAKIGVASSNSPRVNLRWQSLAMRSATLQPSLAISQADDPYEREADRVADQVMRMPATPSDGHTLSITPVTAHQAQRKCAECEEEEKEGSLQRKASGGADAPATAPPIVHETLSSAGQPLDATTRAYFEPRFSSDFSRVRVHTDSRAVESTHAVDALAYTVGKDVVIRGESASPGSPARRRLLAHELTHVIQQGGAARSPAVSLATIGSTQPGIPRLYRTPDDETKESESGCEIEGSLSLSFQTSIGGGSIVASYQTEQETPSAGIGFHWLALIQDVFNNPPFLPLLEKACGQWVRFDIGEISPDTPERMPDSAECSSSEFGECDQEELGQSSVQTMDGADRFGTVWMRISPGITVEAVADSLAFPKIMNLHLQKRASKDNDDIVTEFFSGLAEGLGDDFSSEVNELGRKFATIGHISFLLQPVMLAGAVYEIYSQASDLAETAGALLADPEEAIDLAKAFFESVFMGGAKVAREFGAAIGKDARSKVRALVNAGKTEGEDADSAAGDLARTAKIASDFAFEIGRIIGPIIFEIILDIVSPGAILLRSSANALRAVFKGLSVLPDLGIGARLGSLGGKALRRLMKSRDFFVNGYKHWFALQLSGGKLVCAICSEPCRDLLLRIEAALKSDSLSDDVRQTLTDLQHRVMTHADAWDGLEETKAKAILEEYTEEFERSPKAAQKVVEGDTLSEDGPSDSPVEEPSPAGPEEIDEFEMRAREFERQTTLLSDEEQAGIAADLQSSINQMQQSLNQIPADSPYRFKLKDELTGLTRDRQGMVRPNEPNRLTRREAELLQDRIEYIRELFDAVNSTPADPARVKTATLQLTKNWHEKKIFRKEFEIENTTLESQRMNMIMDQALEIQKETGRAEIPPKFKNELSNIVTDEGVGIHTTQELRAYINKLKENKLELDFEREKAVKDLEKSIAESVGIPADEYEKLRSSTPSKSIKDKIIGASSGEDQVFGGHPNELHADHIVPFTEIIQMTGFASLGPKQRRAVLNFEENLVAMNGKANSSKRNLSWSEWPQWDQWFPPNTPRAEMNRVRSEWQQKENRLRIAIQQEIDRLRQLPKE